MSSPVIPSHEDPVIRGVSTVIGGPVGAHAKPAPGRGVGAVIVCLLLATAVTFGLGYVQKLPCRNHQWTQDYQYTRLCYTDTWALYYAEGLDAGRVPYLEQAVEYPVLIGGIMWVAAQAAYDAEGGDPKRYYDVTAVLLLLCALAATVGLVASAGPRPWDAALFAFAPALVLHGLTNWDLLAVACASLGVACWAKRWPVMAGICFGLGISAKLYPVIFLIPLLALCWRAGRMREGLRTAIATVATVIVVNVPVFLFSGRLLDPTDKCHGPFDPERSWWEFWNRNRCRVSDWDSLWYAAQDRIGSMGLFGKSPGFTFDPFLVNTWSLVFFVAALAAIVALAIRAPRRPRLPQLLFLTVAAFLLVNKVWSPQYVLWLVPLAALARPRWRLFLAWQVAELFLLFTRFYFFVHEGARLAQPSVDRGLRPEWFLSAVVVRDLVLIALMVAVVREIRRPDLDVVRRGGVDDPAGGVLDGAPDREPPEFAGGSRHQTLIDA